MIRRLNIDVVQAARNRINLMLDKVPHPFVSLSGGKDSTILLHLVMDEAIKRGRRIGVLIVDLEAQYKDTITNLEQLVEMYKDHIDLHWVCAEITLRNATSVYEPKWTCWDAEKEAAWVRPKPKHASDLNQ